MLSALPLFEHIRLICRDFSLAPTKLIVQSMRKGVNSGIVLIS